MKKRSVIAEVEAEYGEPFWDVVKSFADDGESIEATAALLGYSGSKTLRIMLKKRGYERWFKPATQTNGFKSAHESRRGKSNRNAITAMQAKNPCYVRLELDGKLDTVAGHAKRIGISVKTVYNRKYRGIDWITALTMPVTAPKLHNRPNNHPWKLSIENRRKKNDQLHN